MFKAPRKSAEIRGEDTDRIRTLSQGYRIQLSMIMIHVESGKCLERQEFAG